MALVASQPSHYAEIVMMIELLILQAEVTCMDAGDSIVTEECGVLFWFWLSLDMDIMFLGGKFQAE